MSRTTLLIAAQALALAALAEAKKKAKSVVVEAVQPSSLASAWAALSQPTTTLGLALRIIAAVALGGALLALLALSSFASEYAGMVAGWTVDVDGWVDDRKPSFGSRAQVMALHRFSCGYRTKVRARE